MMTLSEFSNWLDWSDVLIALSGFVTGILVFSAKKSIGAYINEIITKRRQREKADEKLLAKFLDILPSDKYCIDYFRSRPANQGFLSEHIDALETILYDWKHPEYCFFNKKIEKEKEKFQQAIKKLVDYLTVELFPCEGNPDLYVVPYNLNETDEARYDSAVKQLNEIRLKIVESHKNFIRIARKKLSC